MQKIQFYLVPNRIIVTTDLVGNGFTTEFRQVYQRTLKLYKGIDNVIELDIRSSDQRRQNVAGKTAVLKFYDADHKNLFTVTALANLAKVGLISLTVRKEDLEMIDPQQLKFAALLRQNNQDTMIYTDSQFDLFGTAEVLDGFNDKLDDILETVTMFNYEFDRKEYVSEIANFGTRINNDYSTVPTRSATFSFEGTYNGIIKVEATDDKSTAFGTNWTTIGIWDTDQDSTVTYTGNYRFVRFRIIRDRSAGAGNGARFTITKNNNVYTNVTVTLRGQNYLVGDTLTVKGSMLGGIDGTNDLVITVTGLINGVSSQGNVDTFTWTGIASAGAQTYESIGIDPVTRPPNPVDKIIIRN